MAPAARGALALAMMAAAPSPLRMSDLLPDLLPEAPTFSGAQFRAALGMFATGVTIVTARAPGGQPVGLTVNSFASVSLAPPLVSWNLALGSGSLAVFEQGTHCAVNVLGAGQQALALRFASAGVDRWAGVSWRPGVAGAPLLADAVAHFECETVARHPAGDHVILIGRVEHCDHRAGAAPLLFHGGRFYTEHPL
jgi:flavin reductase (DIM6/NTAB) family NADH-FMN oxidoreductase RutF